MNTQESVVGVVERGGWAQLRGQTELNGISVYKISLMLGYWDTQVSAGGFKSEGGGDTVSVGRKAGGWVLFMPQRAGMESSSFPSWVVWELGGVTGSTEF